jgi:hypothetical protein
MRVLSALLLLLVILALNLSCTSGSTPTPSAAVDPMPLMLWIHYSLFNNYTFGIQNEAGLLRTGTSGFALYDDGQVIYWDDDANQYMVAMLTQEELTHLMEKLPLSDFFRLNAQITAINVPDVDGDTIIIWNEGNSHSVKVYGAGISSENQTPASFLEILEFVDQYTNPNTEPWQGEQMEILFWPQNQEADIDWPENWPIPNCSRWSCIVTLDISYYEQIQAWIEEYYGGRDILTIRMSDAVWQIFYRFVFPHEDLWLNP